MKYLKTIISLLKDRGGFLKEIDENIGVREKIVGLLIISSIFFFVYGVVIGFSNGWRQALSSGLKLPSFYLVNLLICFPSLYFFNIFFGSKRTAAQHFSLLLCMNAVISVLLFSFAPVTLFFMITTTSYVFFKLLNVFLFMVTAFIGIKFFYSTFKIIPEPDAEGIGPRKRFTFFWIWIYAFVGSQLGWILRPFFGHPNLPFEIFRHIGGNVYLDILRSIGVFMGID